jgi:hypothetical protein
MADEAIAKCGSEVMCSPLAERVQPGYHAKGLNCAEVMNMASGKISGFLVMYKTSSKDKGLVLNFCPWCGAEINQRHRGK